MIETLKNLVAERRGAVALEALLSIIILMLTISITWGICILIFNFSVISTSTQLASQAGLLIYDRDTYRGDTNYDRLQREAAEARRVAQLVFRENSCAAVRGQFDDGALPNSGCREIPGPGIDPRFRAEIQCRTSDDDAITSGWRDCAGGLLSACEATMLRFTSRARIDIPFSYLVNAGRQDGVQTADVTSRSFSFINVGALGAC